MDYLVHGKTYSWSYQELRKDYEKFIAMSDDVFLENIVKALHFACFVSYIKELTADRVLIDEGIIHELIHLIDEDTKEGALRRLTQIREDFKETLKLI